MFKEEEHKRVPKGSPRGGQFTKSSDGAGGTHEATPAEESRLKELGIVQSGAISGAQSGALNPDNEKDRERTERHAKITYERIRRTNGDIKKIAKVTGFSEEDIERIKNHMFFNEYELEGGKHRFDPDFYQAQSWDRLQRGEPIEADLILLRHEKIEEELMRNGLGYEEAHETANKTANYAKAVEEYNNGKVKKKRN